MSFLFNLIIQPLIMVYDVLFSMFYGILENTVAAIVALSILINILVLPLYRKADIMQKEQHDKSLKMQKWVDHIKKHFRGDERFMILSAYYRIEGYSPVESLKEAGPLLLQVPFFIAAYQYISSLTLLRGSSWGPIKDLLEPDGLLTIAGISINILPIIMTLINWISGYIYSKDLMLRQKIQIYALAIVFLVLLYNSPSGLVLYWIMNNLFSLCKNIYYQKLVKYGDYINVILSFVLIVFIIVELASFNINRDTDVFIAESILICVIINLVATALKIKNLDPLRKFGKLNSVLSECDRKTTIMRLILPESCLVMLLGLYIPSSVISSSPAEFVNLSDGSFQSDLLTYPVVVYAGLLLIWTTVMILSREGRKRQIMILLLWAATGVVLYNQFLAPADTGTLYADMTFDDILKFSGISIAINLMISIIAASVMVILAVTTRKLYRSVAVIICIALLVLPAVNIYKIDKELKQFAGIAYESQSTVKPLSLSRTGKNVIVFMLDRAIGSYVPYIFEEKPELKESFEGFVYYPNTVSFGLKTNYGAPALFGGYEYTPREMDKRSNELLKDKHNEAIKVMPVLFMNEGYRVTVCDPPYANYQGIPDLSIYDGYEGINAYNLTGKYTDEFNYGLMGNVELRQKHNFLFYSLFRTAPYFMRNILYDGGHYFSIGIDSGTGYSATMLDSYSVLWNLPNITSIYDDDQGSFLMLQNATPHNPTVLNPPDFAVNGSAIDRNYKYSDKVYEGRVMKIETDRQWGHYCINVATYQALAVWLDSLKAAGVYDNTRIIFVADHGYYISQFPDLIHPQGLDVESLNPLLMVKDFDSHAEFSSDSQFMTNADVPMLAMAGVIDNPVNPFTGVQIDDHIKQEGTVIVTDSYNWVVSQNNGTVYDLDGGNWWSVHDDIYDMNNWALVGEEGAV